MKKTICIIAILFAVSTASFAQKEGKEKDEEKNESKKHVKVPAVVTTAFAKDFPGVTGKWDKEGNDYEVNFKQNGNTMSALYDANGNKYDLAGRTTITLCRCGHSNKKPFCDGSHKTCGFESEVAAYTLEPKKQS